MLISRGLADGLDYDKESAEGKLITALDRPWWAKMAGAIDEIDSSMDEIDSDLEELNDYIEEVDSDLGDVEEYLFGDEDDDDYYDDDEECDGNMLRLRRGLRRRRFPYDVLPSLQRGDLL